MVVVVDDEDRENEGDLVMAASRCTSEAMAFIIKHTSGVVCVPMEGADLDRLRRAGHRCTAGRQGGLSRPPP
jgi:3,4-dihydroxy 2-butanone 4-phosphate synthase/GTP cyclohydrolase II